MTTTEAPPRDTRLIGVVVALTAVLALMVFAFAAPATNSGAHDLPLAVGGPAAATSQVTAGLEREAAGAFAVTTYPTAEAATDAVADREAIGAITVGADGVTIVTATAAGAPYAPLLRSIGAGLSGAGQQVNYSEVAPYTEDDPAGGGLTAVALPIIFGGMISAVVLSTLFAGTGRARRVLAASAFSVLAGFAITAILQYGFGSFNGTYWLTALGVALAIGAVSLTVLGLESTFGYPGLGIGAVTMLFVANPLSGFATGWQWLPQPWGEIGQYLPVGAAGTEIRSLAFFDGGGAGHAVAVLAVWALAGVGLTLVSSLLRSRAARRPVDAH